MATIHKEITVKTTGDQVWEAMRDIDALHSRLVPGFVIDTKLEPGARTVTFANGRVVRERIITIDDDARRLVWSATGDLLAHHNASAQASRSQTGGAVLSGSPICCPIRWAAVEQMMEDAMAAMRAALDG